MIKIKLFFIFIIFLLSFYSCEKELSFCEEHHTGDVMLYNDETISPCYAEITWSNGAQTNISIPSYIFFENVQAGRALIFMQWEDPDFYYTADGYIDILQCATVNGYLYFGKKSSYLENRLNIETFKKTKK